MPVLYRAHPTKRPFDTLVVIPVDVFFDKGEHLDAVALLLMLGVEGLDLYTPEEALRCFDEHPVGELRVGAEPGVFRQINLRVGGR